MGASEASPVTLRVGGQAVWVDTGDPIPEGFDAVVMIEVVHETGTGAVEIYSPVAPYQHVRPLGEDIVATELLLAQGHRLKPHDVAACAAAGLTEAVVRRRPIVAIIPTGNEIVPPGQARSPGQVPEFNSLMLAGMVSDWGGSPLRLDPVPDSVELLRASVAGAAEKADVVVVNAGSSAGSEDYTARVVESLGRLVVHGVAVRPGHPVVLGVGNGKALLGIPGIPRLGRHYVGAVPQASDRDEARRPRQRPGEDPGHHGAEGLLATRRGRVPARQGRAGRRQDGRGPHPARRWGDNVAGEG